MSVKNTLSNNDFSIFMARGTAITDGEAYKNNTGKDRGLVVMQVNKHWLDAITGEKRTITSEYRIIARSLEVIKDIKKILKGQAFFVKGTLESYKMEKNPGEIRKYTFILANHLIIEKDANKSIPDFENYPSTKASEGPEHTDNFDFYNKSSKQSNFIDYDKKSDTEDSDEIPLN